MKYAITKKNGERYEFDDMDSAMAFINRHDDISTNMAKSTVGAEIVHLLDKSNFYAFDNKTRFEAMDRLARSVYGRGLTLSSTIYVITDYTKNYSFVLGGSYGTPEKDQYTAIGFAAEWGGAKFEAITASDGGYSLSNQVRTDIEELAKKLNRPAEELVEQACANLVAAYVLTEKVNSMW